jgi:hypothetical protein
MGSRQIRRCGYLGVALLSATLFGLSGCDENAQTGGSAISEPPRGVEKPDALQSSPSTLSLEVAGGDAGSARARRLASGEFRASLNAGRLTAEGNAASQIALVARVAKLAAARIEVGTVDTQPVSVEIVDLPLPQALPILLAGLPYTSVYRFDTGQNRHVLVELRVGKLAPQITTAELTAESAGGRDSVGSRAARSRPQAEEILPAPPVLDPVTLSRDHALKRRVILDDRKKSEQLQRAERGTTTSERRRGITSINPQGEGLAVLLRSLATDPDPKVRAAAAERLGRGQGYAATRGLVEGLQDPDPDVRVRSILGLSEMRDPSVLDELERARNESADARVQAAADQAIASMLSRGGMAADADNDTRRGAPASPAGN